MLGGKMRGLQVLLLTTAGRRSGRSHTVPLGFFDWQGGYLVAASNSGRPSYPAWYYNLINHPRVTIQVYDKIVLVTAEVLAGEARAQAWQQVIASVPLYAEYEKRATREIPLVLLRPSNFPR
jgi:deazaflavin-dependent oxidoreductase (nitroreductase family)